MSEQNFPEDEFDVAEGTRPRGVHRAPEPWWRWMLPFVVVLVVVPALAWGLMYMLSPETPDTAQTGNGSSTATASTPDSDNTAEGDETAESAEGQSDDAAVGSKPKLQGSDESDQSDESAQPGSVNHDVNVRVLNGIGKQGLAGQVAGTLKAAGYAKNTADNAHGWASKVSAVYYSSDDLKATAEDVAKRLKIGEVKPSPKGGKNEVVVLLRKDFRK